MRDKQALLLVPLGLRASSYLVWATSDRAAVQRTERAVFPGLLIWFRNLQQRSEPRVPSQCGHGVDRSLQSHGTAVAAAGGHCSVNIVE